MPTSPKRVCIISPAPPLRGGIADATESLCLEYQRQDTDCWVASYSLLYPGVFFPGKRQTIQGDSSITVRPLINSLWPVSWWRTARAIVASQPDVVVAAYWHPWFAVCLTFMLRCLRRRGIRTVALVHNLYAHNRRFPLQRWLARWVLRQCDAVVTLSASVQQQVHALCPQKSVQMVPHPPYGLFGPALSKSAARQQLALAADARYILFFGLVRGYKGINLFVEALATPALQDLQVQALIVGENYGSENRLQQTIEEKGLSSRVHRVNAFVSRAEATAYFCAADMVVQPYTKATQSGVTQIARALCRPALVTSVGALSAQVEDGQTGYVVEPDSAAIATAIVDFYTRNREPDFVTALQVVDQPADWSGVAAAISTL